MQVAVQSHIPDIGDDADNPAQWFFDLRSNILANENPLSHRIRQVARRRRERRDFHGREVG